MMDKYLVFESLEQAEKAVPLNSIRKIKIDSVIICIANTLKGFVAFEKDCPHMSGDLSCGNVNNQMEVVCPWHSYRFNLFSGEECERRCKPIKLYDIVWEQGQLFII